MTTGADTKGPESPGYLSAGKGSLPLCGSGMVFSLSQRDTPGRMAAVRQTDEETTHLEAIPTMVRSLIRNKATYYRAIGFPYPMIHRNGKTSCLALDRWLRTLALWDQETAGHSTRVTEMTLRLCRAMQLSEAELLPMRYGALLHDIGKLRIPGYILRKSGPLSEAEWAIMRQHPVYGYKLLTSITMPGPVLEIAHYHHERWDGRGYPLGLRGEDIPLSARIFAIVDVWDALRSNRPYRAAWSEEMVWEHIRQRSGEDFDPEVARVFLRMQSSNLQGGL